MVNVYLDVDGVINAVSNKPPRVNTQWKGEWSKEPINGYSILWSHELVDAINQLAARDDVTIKWLTTWQEDAPQIFAPQTGINGEEWEVLYGNINDHWFTTGRWWKLQAIQEDLDKDPSDKVVWIDDDLGYDRSAQEWLLNHPEIHVVSPVTAHGVTKKQFDGIMEFINES